MLIFAAIFTPIIAGLIPQQWRNLMIGLVVSPGDCNFTFGAIGHYPQFMFELGPFELRLTDGRLQQLSFLAWLRPSCVGATSLLD